MDVIRLSTDGLQRLAARHVAVSVDIASNVPGPTNGSSAQSTSTAIAGGYDALRAASSVLAARLKTTGAKLGAAGKQLADQEGGSAQRLAAVNLSIAT